eukprot:RCo014307
MSFHSAGFAPLGGSLRTGTPTWARRQSSGIPAVGGPAKSTISLVCADGAMCRELDQTRRELEKLRMELLESRQQSRASCDTPTSTPAASAIQPPATSDAGEGHADPSAVAAARPPRQPSCPPESTTRRPATQQH